MISILFVILWIAAFVAAVVPAIGTWVYVQILGVKLWLSQRIYKTSNNH